MKSIVKSMAIAAAAIIVLSVGSAQAGIFKSVKVKSSKCAPVVVCNPCPVVYYEVVKPVCAPVVYYEVVKPVVCEPVVYCDPIPVVYCPPATPVVYYDPCPVVVCDPCPTVVSYPTVVTYPTVVSCAPVVSCPPVVYSYVSSVTYCL